jgi:hypothetical protein
MLSVELNISLTLALGAHIYSRASSSQSLGFPIWRFPFEAGTMIKEFTQLRYLESDLIASA